jgi:hypothetical protein
VLERIDGGDPQCVADEASGGRSPPRPDRYPPLSRSVHDVPHDEEVPFEAHPRDHAELVPNAVDDPFRHRGNALREMLHDEVLEVFGRAAVPARQRKLGQVRAPADELEIALLRDLRGRLEALRKLLKQGAHLIGRLDVRLRIGPQRAGGIVEILPCLQAQ